MHALSSPRNNLCWKISLCVSCGHRTASRTNIDVRTQRCFLRHKRKQHKLESCLWAGENKVESFVKVTVKTCRCKSNLRGPECLVYLMTTKVNDVQLDTTYVLYTLLQLWLFLLCSISHHHFNSLVELVALWSNASLRVILCVPQELKTCMIVSRL